MKDTIILDNKKEALGFYTECLACGIVARYMGMSVTMDSLEPYFTVQVDVEKTVELKNTKEV